MPSFQIYITDEVHAIVAAQRAGTLGHELGLSLVEVTALRTAILEVAKNIVRYAHSGTIEIRTICPENGARGVEVIASDQGPGIADIALAMRDGYSTGGGLGLGLPGAKRLMSTFEINSQAGQGTNIIMRKYHHER